MIILGPWQRYDTYGIWRRKLLSKSIDTPISDIYIYERSIYEPSSEDTFASKAYRTTVGDFVAFSTLQEAMEYVDRYLIKSGYTLLSEEKFEKLKILV